MGKSRNKTHSEVEYLRGEVKRLKAELKYFKRRDHIHSEIVEEVLEEQDLDITDMNVCQHCGKGIILEYDFTHLLLRRCGTCDWQEKIKKK